MAITVAVLLRNTGIHPSPRIIGLWLVKFRRGALTSLLCELSDGDNVGRLCVVPAGKVVFPSLTLLFPLRFTNDFR
jgi:hypothetical protein